MKDPNTLYNKGTTAYHEKKYDKAIKLLKESHKISPSKEGALNLGACYKMKGDLKTALKWFLESEKMDAKYPLALNNIGLIYHMQNNEKVAFDYFDRATKLDPNYPDAGWNKGLSLLKDACSGQFEKFRDAWYNYEWRFLKSGPVQLSRTDKPRWTGAEDGTILVMNEQGIGDVVMFARYLPYLKEKVKKVILQIPEALHPLFEESDIDITYVSSVDHDYYVPICSLAAYFPFIPATGYLKFEGESPLKGGIGVVWKGNPQHGNDANRSTYEANFKFLNKYGLPVYSLQYGEKSKHFENLEINTWADTVKYIAGLDIVVTIDSSVAHVAAAMGKPTYIMLPGIDTDFRWGLGKTTCLWYSNAYLVRNMNFKELEEQLCMKLQKPQSEDSAMEISSNTLAVEA